jgi:hypothetical protein
MTKAGQITFEAAKEEVLSAAPPSFTFSNPPSIGWWRARFGLHLPTAVFAHHYQSILGAKTYLSQDDVHWNTDLAVGWQAGAGITARQWPSVQSELGDNGNGLLCFSVGPFKGTKATRVRPTGQFLAIFGMTLATFDLVHHLDSRTLWRLQGVKGGKAAAAAAKPVSPEELGALTVWAVRGGLPRLRCVSELEQLLRIHGSAQMPSHA